MKRFLAIFLALAATLTVSLTACGKKDENPDDTLDDPIIDTPVDPGTPGTPDDPSDPSQGTTVPNPDKNDQTTENDVTTTVYPMTDMVIRKDSITSSNTATVTRGTALSAVGVIKNSLGDPIWYKLSYNGGTYYADADFVTENSSEATFTALSEELTIKVKNHPEGEDPYQVNLRKYPSFDSNVTIVTVKKEHTDVNPIIAKEVNGTGNWYYVTYNGSNYYLAVTSVTRPVLEGIPTGGSQGGDLPG